MRFVQMLNMFDMVAQLVQFHNHLSTLHLVFVQRAYTQHGKVLGGGSSVNHMMYARGHKDDYNS